MFELNLVTSIIGITVIVSLFAFNDPPLMAKLTMNPFMIKHRNEYYRFITSGFIHINFMHLFFNMFVLYSFGEAVLIYYKIVFQEKGLYYFFLLYMGGIVFSDMPSYLRHHENPAYNSLGASGAVSAVLFAAIFFNPLGKIGMLFIPFQIPGVVFGALYMAYTYYMGRRGGDNINHDAHLFGAIFGILFTIALKPSLVLLFIHNIQSFFN